MTRRRPPTWAASPCGPVAPRRWAAPLARADAIVIGGGSIFKTMHPASGRRPRGLLANVAALGATSTLRGRPLALLGVGASDLPDWTSRALARFIVRHPTCWSCETRSRPTRCSGQAYPVRSAVGADPAWTLLRPPEARPSPRPLGSGRAVHLRRRRRWMGRHGAADGGHGAAPARCGPSRACAGLAAPDACDADRR